MFLYFDFDFPRNIDHCVGQSVRLSVSPQLSKLFGLLRATSKSESCRVNCLLFLR